MQATLILLVIGAVILLAQATDYSDYRLPSCGRCNFRDFKGRQGPPGRLLSVITGLLLLL